MLVSAQRAGKKFAKQWIFKSFSYTFEAGKRYAIIGPNGSGKTTLLKAISGILSLSEGFIHYSLTKEEQPFASENLFQHTAYVGVYSKLPEELNLKEFFYFFKKFKQTTTSLAGFADSLGLNNDYEKAIKDFSSGMQQKLKLGLALCTDVSLILLDEPCTNLDTSNVSWYLSQFSTISRGKTLIICSNQKHEYDFCDDIIDITGYKN